MNEIALNPKLDDTLDPRSLGQLRQWDAGHRRALMTRPELVLLDEPSMGLAPMIVEEIFEIVTQLNA